MAPEARFSQVGLMIGGRSNSSHFAPASVENGLFLRSGAKCWRRGGLGQRPPLRFGCGRDGPEDRRTGDRFLASNHSGCIDSADASLRVQIEKHLEIRIGAIIL